MNAGVSTTPEAVWSRPVRAAPSRAAISNRSRCGSRRTTRTVGSGLRLGRLPVEAPVADRDPVRLACLGRGDADLEHAAVEIGADSIRVAVDGQRHRARAGAQITLRPD